MSYSNKGPKIAPPPSPSNRSTSSSMGPLSPNSVVSVGRTYSRVKVRGGAQEWAEGICIIHVVSFFTSTILSPKKSKTQQSKYFSNSFILNRPEMYVHVHTLYMYVYVHPSMYVEFQNNIHMYYSLPMHGVW